MDWGSIEPAFDATQWLPNGLSPAAEICATSPSKTQYNKRKTRTIYSGGENENRGLRERRKFMKKLTIFAVTLFYLAAATAMALAADKTGEVKDNVYTDAKFGFGITGLQNWKVKNQNEPSLCPGDGPPDLLKALGLRAD